MRPFAAILVLFAVSGLLLPGLTAQDKKEVEKKDAKDEKKDAKDEKKDAGKKDAKDEKKAVDKKGDEKKGDDEKKDEKKSDSPKKAEGKTKKTIDPEEEKLLTGTFVLRAKIQNMDANSAGEFTVQLPYPYQPKVQAAKQWYAQQIAQKTFTLETINQFKMKMSQANMVEVRSGANMKVRTGFPPTEYDAKGNLKRWTSKEVAALKGSSRLPGFPAQFDAVRSGQIVDLYVPKLPAKKGVVAKKKMVDDDADDPLLKPEVVMIVVVFEAPAR